MIDGCPRRQSYFKNPLEYLGFINRENPLEYLSFEGG